MKIWIDAQLPPTLANWVSATFGLEAAALRDLSLRDAQDIEIFEAARAENAVIMTKDSDFIDLVCRLGTHADLLESISKILNDLLVMPCFSFLGGLNINEVDSDYALTENRAA
jgi:hypothetical protein